MKMQPLKTLCFFLTLALLGIQVYGQNPIKNYLNEWKKIDDLITKKNLPKSALVEVKNIYALAKKEKQDAQVIKAVVYMIRLQQDTREENAELGIKEIEKEITVSKEPVVSIFKSLLADVYWNYYQQNRWKFYNRTETKEFNKADISTWSAGDFHKKISELYLQSIKEEKLLQQTKLAPYDAIIIKGNVRHLRPTLFDLLANRALGYFENDERDIAKPAYAFEINDPAAFDPAADFIKKRFATRDSLSLHHKALLVYQELIAFHLNDAKPDALLDADIQRLNFVYRHSTHADKRSLYRVALNHIADKYGNHPAAAQVWYLLAQEHYIDGNSYSPVGDTTHRFAKVKAKEILERILTQKDSSEGKINSYNLLNEINKKELHFSVEKVNTPGQPFRTFVQYRNIKRLSLRLIKADENLKERMANYYDEKVWAELIARTPTRNWQQDLPATNDYQQHGVEVKIDALPVGEYILLATPENFSKNGVMGARLFYVSDISFINQSKDYFVLHRETGQPLANATVQIWQQVYDYKNSKYTTEKGKQYKADNNGFFRLAETEIQDNNRRRENFKLEINWKNDRLFMDDLQYDHYYYKDNTPEPKNNYRVFFFTDRSIYRPGQVLYFKGIAITNDQEQKNKVLINYETKVFLRDANQQVVDSMIVRTNEYGSFNGKFQLPQGVLNGEFGIYAKDNTGAVEFSVEEYKRPKFYVEYEKIKGTYKVNDKIKITGVAKAYAGNNIDGAPVKYRVIRQPRFLYPWMFWRGWFPPSAPMEIAHGETKTGKDGKFTIEFEAIPDKTIDKKFDPVFDYKIYADVTDINGETRSGETVITVGYKSLLLKVDLPSSLPVDSLKNISIRTENMAGEFEPATVNVTITKLKDEKRLIRSRYWQQPDQFVMSKEEYLRNFPYDEYKNETDPKSWEKGEVVFNRSDSVRVNGQWAMGNGQFTPGWYVIEIVTKDKNGEEVKDIKFIELFDEKKNELATSQYLWTQGSKPIEPGERTSVKLGSSANNLFVVQQIDKKPVNSQQSTAIYTFTSLNNEKKTFEFTATEADRGGYGVNYFFVKHNRFYQFNDVIQVPWSNKDLKVEYATFRDKTLPGSEEKWNVKITGYKKELVAAEMLASMYDASLDQFKPHQWSTPSIWPVYSNYNKWNSILNFAAIESQEKPFGEVESKNILKNYDELIRIGIGGRGGGILMREKMNAAPPNVQYRKGLDLLTSSVGSKEEDAAANQSDTIAASPTPVIDNSQIQIRKNFNETAFFFPELRTDGNGAIEFSFTLPEALTKWKFQALTHTKDLAFGYSSKEIVTQKQLMVQPNAPRFLREGDRMEFSAKIVNLSEKEITGQAQLLLFDATTNQSVDGWFRNTFPNQFFTVAAGQSEAVNFPIDVPYQFNKALVWRIVASAGAVSDGEEAALPVLTNRMLVTETITLPMRGTATKNFSFDKLKNSGGSETLQHHALTVEYTSNPAWYAVQALPYLMEYPYDCAEQVWNRYYANALATTIANSSPRIKQIFESWKTKDTAALLSNLQKNQELKAVLLEETPWVLQAKSEEQQKKNIALLFDLVRMSNELNSSLEKLKQMQSPNGGFVWFKGGPDDRYITQYIVTGIGHLQRITGIGKNNLQSQKLESILAMAIPYLDLKLKEDYDNLKKRTKDLKGQHIGYYEIQYLYMRSFFSKYPISKASQEAYNYYRGQAKQYWVKQTKYMQGMIALALYRSGDKTIPAAILKSLKETSINHEELGMYWKDQASGGWFWHQAPIETQALMIEAFQEIGKDTKTVDDLRTWLLKNKQTNNWRTTKATAEACYALLLQGTEWLTNEPSVEIKLGNIVVDNKTKAEAGTGYFKKTVEGQFVKPEMGNISVSLTPSPSPQSGEGSASPSWGGVYWQYFEDLDKITSASTPLSLVKKLFVETNTDRGPVLTPVKEGDALKVGDKIKVRVELRVDRDMEYVHMKDMRASGMEPVNVLSGYKWQGGLGYYETTRDASTNFFFSYLRKGVYVFEYPLFVTNKGNFSNGITTIQSMYAPEFSAHSEGIRINVE